MDGPSCSESLVNEEMVDSAMRLCNAYVVRGEKRVDDATVFMAGDRIEAESGGNISSTACTPSPCGLRAMVAGSPGAGLNTGEGGLEWSVGWLLFVERVADELRLGALWLLDSDDSE